MNGKSLHLGIDESISDDARNEAKQIIGDSLLSELEVLLGLDTPHAMFRRRVLNAVVQYRYAMAESGQGAELRELQCLQKLQKALIQLHKLMDSTASDPAMAAAILNVTGHAWDSTTRTPSVGEAPLYGLHSQTLGPMLSELTHHANECIRERTTQSSQNRQTRNKIPEKFSIQIADAVDDLTAMCPEITTNAEKSHYQGSFFFTVDKLLCKLGHRQQNAARGLMIMRALFPDRYATYRRRSNKEAKSGS